MKCKIKKIKNSTCIQIGEKIYPFAATRSFRPEGRIIKQFSDHKMKFFNIFPSGIMTALANRTVPYSIFGPVWVGESEYCWDNLRKQCEEVIGNLDEDTYVSVSVHLDPPDWFVKSHGLVDHWEQMVQNLGCEEWKKAAADYMCALIDKMDEWYPDKVYAIFLFQGGTTEWYSYYMDRVIGNPTELQQATFRKYTDNKYDKIPSPAVLHGAEDGVLRHPVIDRPAIDYWKYVNDVTMDTARYFAHIVKEHTNGDKLVGMFNSQIYGLCLDGAVRMAFNNTENLANCEDIDIIMSPASYTSRKLSSTSAIRVPVDSLSLFDKLFVHEIDSSTHLIKKQKTSDNSSASQHAKARDESFVCTEDTKMYMRREVGIVLAKGQGYWWFDMFSGYYDDAELMKEIEDLGNLQQKIAERGSRSVSEVICMLDRNSNFMLKTDCYYRTPEYQTIELNGCGVPWDMGDTFNFFHKNFPKEQYKLYIFPALFAPDEKVKAEINKLREDGKSTLFIHAPGYITEEGFSEEAMETLTGIRLKKCNLSDNTIVPAEGYDFPSFDFTTATNEMDIWKHDGEGEMISPMFTAENLDIVFGVFRETGQPAMGLKFREDGGFDAFSACGPVPKEIISELYKHASIFRYTDHLEPVYTSDVFECAYSFEGGRRMLYRPAKAVLTDYFTNEQFVVGPDGIEIDFKPHETKMLIVEEI